MCSAKFGIAGKPFSKIDMLVGSRTGETFSGYIDREIGLNYFRPSTKKPEKKSEEQKSYKYRT